MPDEPSSVSTSDSLVATLAAIEHERWSHWQRYLHAQCDRRRDGALVIPPELVTRWERQMSTPFSDLPEAEKESDKEQVLRYLPAITAALNGARDKLDCS